ncbi:hypothetical protein JHE03_06260 [Pluralibacter gergoviae]|uniref:hypothetical protein n=1 Tax=Pluralibacter gergoviae TaxID=61647 RepID=UPI00190C06A1|nr:hypothetical protein [Pluralibacter gergoviae]ELC3072748.1 hypothetical protein [Pluralibacter gergoviae]MBK4115891.1 hypothetical protein [Pluralibacter gergoviae]
MDIDLPFLAEVLIGGLLSGVMYSLVALGFVLVYKSLGVFNFAQGAMLLFAAAIAGLLVLALSLLFRYTRTGLAFRAVAADAFAGLAVGLNIGRLWAYMQQNKITPRTCGDESLVG